MFSNKYIIIFANNIQSCWLHPPQIGPEVVQGPGGVITSSTLLGPVFVWSQQNYLKFLLTVRYSES